MVTLEEYYKHATEIRKVNPNETREVKPEELQPQWQVVFYAVKDLQNEVKGLREDVAKLQLVRGTVLQPRFVSVSSLPFLPRQGVVVPLNVTLTSAGSVTVYVPSAGRRVKVTAWSFYTNADVVVELRFGVSGNVIAGLPFKGCLAMNNFGNECPTGDVDEKVEVYGGGAVTVKGWICIVEV
jgi:hypothetical protein